jgi:hypothetical protein
MIVFATDHWHWPWRVSADGGESVLPSRTRRERPRSRRLDGSGVLFAVTAGAGDNAQVAVLDPRTGRGIPSAGWAGRRAAGSLRCRSQVFGSDWILIYAVAGTLRAVSSDRSGSRGSGDGRQDTDEGERRHAVSRSGIPVYAGGRL